MPSSSNILLAIIGFITTPATGQLEWANNFWTTGDCGPSANFSRIYYAGLAGNKGAESCITIGNDQADDCGVLHQDYTGTYGYECTGPDGLGLSGAALSSVSGYNASCDFYTDSHCERGHYHYDLTLLFDPVTGFPDPQCHSTISEDGKAVKSFKCKYLAGVT